MFKFSSYPDKIKYFLVNLSEVEGRLDPIFYSANTKKFIKGKFPISTIRNISTSIKSGIGAGKQDQADKENGIIQIRPTNITNDGFLNFDKNIYLPKNSLANKINKNDILFNNTNSQELVGKTAFAENIDGYFYSNHITKITTNSNIKAKYLWILLNTYQRNKIFYSICTNWNNQSGVGIELLRSLKIPLPPKEMQQQIIDVYEIAYKTKQQKEAESEKLLSSIDEYLLGELGITLPKKDNSLENRIFKVNFSEVTGGNLSPIYSLKLKYSNYNSTFPKYQLKDIAIMYQPKTITQQEMSKNGKYKVYGANGHIGYYNKYNHLYSEIMITCRGATCGEVNKSEPKSWITGNAMVIKLTKDFIIHDYLFYILKTLDLNIIITGSAQPQITRENLKTFKIPIPPLEKQNEIAEHIKQIREQAKQLKQEAKEVLEQAKQEVEKMILGE